MNVKSKTESWRLNSKAVELNRKEGERGETSAVAIAAARRASPSIELRDEKHKHKCSTILLADRASKFQLELPRGL